MEEAITLEAQIKSVKRELALRRVVYPSRVASGKMSEGQAEKELATMEAVLRTLEEAQRRRAAVLSDPRRSNPL